jgi:hypothetical protein
MTLRVLILVAVAAAPVSGRAQTKKELAFSVASDVAVRIHNLVGVTRVSGWDQDSIRVIASIPSHGGRLYGGGSGRMAKLGIEGQDPTLTGPGSLLEVRVPRGARIWIKGAAAKVELQNLGGEIEVSSVTGAVTVEGTPRVSTIETIDGDVSIAGAATVVRARTGAGAVRITGARGDLSVTTIQGPITLESDEILSARLESVSGTIEVRAGVPLDGRIEVETHDGNVGLHLPHPVDARFDLSTVKGQIVTQLNGAPATRLAEQSARFAVGKKAGAGRGAGITVRTFSGEIRVDSGLAYRQ